MRCLSTPKTPKTAKTAMKNSIPETIAQKTMPSQWSRHHSRLLMFQPSRWPEELKNWRIRTLISSLYGIIECGGVSAMKRSLVHCLAVVMVFHLLGCSHDSGASNPNGDEARARILVPTTTTLRGITIRPCLRSCGIPVAIPWCILSYLKRTDRWSN